jgi:hypothetical protein
MLWTDYGQIMDWILSWTYLIIMDWVWFWTLTLHCRAELNMGWYPSISRPTLNWTWTEIRPNIVGSYHTPSSITQQFQYHCEGSKVLDLREKKIARNRRKLLGSRMGVTTQSWDRIWQWQPQDFWIFLGSRVDISCDVITRCDPKSQTRIAPPRSQNKSWIYLKI